MNLRNKAFAIIGILGTLFLAVTYFFQPPSVYFHLAIILFLTISVSVGLYFLLIKRIEQLRQEALQAKTNLSHCDTKGHDEISDIANQINALTDTIEVTQKELENRIKTCKNIFRT